MRLVGFALALNAAIRLGVAATFTAAVPGYHGGVYLWVFTGIVWLWVTESILENAIRYLDGRAWMVYAPPLDRGGPLSAYEGDSGPTHPDEEDEE